MNKNLVLTKRDFPSWYVFDYRSMTHGDSFALDEKDLGADGCKKIIELAKKQDVELFSHKDNEGNVIFWFIASLKKDDDTANKKAAFEAIWKAGEKGLTLREMSKIRPLSKWLAPYRRSILDHLESENLVLKYLSNTSGRPTTTYYAVRK